MLALYLLLLVGGLILTVALYRRGSRQFLTAAVGTLLAMFAVVSGFSVGIYVAPAALVVLLVAGWGLRTRDENDASGGRP